MSTASDRLNRLLTLVPWLIANSGVSLDDAAEHFGITRKQLESDLYLLIVSGLPGYGPEHLVDIQFWDDDSIHVLDPQTLDRPLRLSAHEAFALQLGLRTLAQVSNDPALTSAMAKLEHAAGDAIDVPVLSTSDPVAVLDTVRAALDQHRVLRIEYAGASTDAASVREIEPMRLIAGADHATLEAWCREAGAMRSFRLDRFVRAELTDEAFTPRSAAEPVTIERDVVVELVLQPSAQWVVERHGAEFTVRDDMLHATMRVADPRWIVRLVLAQAGAVTIVNPPEVVELVAVEAAAALRAYG